MTRKPLIRATSSESELGVQSPAEDIRSPAMSKGCQVRRMELHQLARYFFRSRSLSKVVLDMAWGVVQLWGHHCHITISLSMFIKM